RLAGDRSGTGGRARGGRVRARPSRRGHPLAPACARRRHARARAGPGPDRVPAGRQAARVTDHCFSVPPLPAGPAGEHPGRPVLALYRATPDPKEAAGTIGPALAKLGKPALVLWGAKDPFADVQYAERQRGFFEVRDVVVLPDSGHWPFKDHPAAVERPLVA